LNVHFLGKNPKVQVVPKMVAELLKGKQYLRILSPYPPRRARLALMSEPLTTAIIVAGGRGQRAWGRYS
jgi:hypothetical protein